MLDTTITRGQMWSIMQQPCTASYVPNSYLLLLSALDNGWRIEQAALVPSWDQNGFLYLVTLRHHVTPVRQELILPKNQVVDDLLDEYREDAPCCWTGYQVAQE